MEGTHQLVLAYGDQQLVGPTSSISRGHSGVLGLEVPGNLLTGGVGYPHRRVEEDFNHGPPVTVCLQREWVQGAAWAVSLPSGLPFLSLSSSGCTVGRQWQRIRGGNHGISSPGLGLSHLEGFGQRQCLDLPGVFPANDQGSRKVHLGLGQGGQGRIRLLEGGLVFLVVGNKSVLVWGPLVHVGHLCRRQVGSVVQLLTPEDDRMVEAARLNPLLVFGQGGEGEGSLPLED